MALTYQKVVDKARNTLNDSGKEVYTDLELLDYATEAIHLLMTYRPDLFIGSFSNLPVSPALTDNLPFNDRFSPPLIQYIIGRAQSKDDTHVVEQRAQTFLEMFGVTAKGA